MDLQMVFNSRLRPYLHRHSFPLSDLRYVTTTHHSYQRGVRPLVEFEWSCKDLFVYRPQQWSVWTPGGVLLLKGWVQGYQYVDKTSYEGLGPSVQANLWSFKIFTCSQPLFDCWSGHAFYSDVLGQHITLPERRESAYPWISG